MSPPVSARLTFSRPEIDAVLKAAVGDNTLLPAQQRDLHRALMEASMGSRSALRKLCEVRAPRSWPTAELQHFVQLAWRACEAAPLPRRYFLDWMRQQGESWETLLGREFFEKHFSEKSETPDAVPLLSPSQQRAWDTMDAMADLYFAGPSSPSTILPRTSLLLAGPSGVGKSHLIRAFAKARGLSYLQLSYGGWLVAGSKQEPHTIEVLREFLLSHKKVALHIDEADKIGSGCHNEWSVALRNELYAILDRTVFSSGVDGYRPNASRAEMQLKNSCFVVATGTWQDLWPVSGGERVPVGFVPAASAPMAAKIRAARVIPTELLNRFFDEVVLLEPMSEADFARVLDGSGLTKLALALDFPVDLASAVASGLGMRWVEGIATRLQLRARVAARATPGSTSTDRDKVAPSI